MQGWGKLINAVLLSLMRCVCEYYAALLSSRANLSAPHKLVCRHDQVTRQAGHVGLMGRTGEEGTLSDVVPVHLYCPA